MTVNYDYLYDQTVAGPDSHNHWVDLIVDVLQSSSRTQATLVEGEWAWDSEAVKKVLAVSPAGLQSVLQRRIK